MVRPPTEQTIERLRQRENVLHVGLGVGEILTPHYLFEPEHRDTQLACGSAYVLPKQCGILRRLEFVRRCCRCL